ncbi:MAG: hypothetical protein ACNI3A_17500 [Desulfovibrio sp.]|uniref:hypothetical protein n=1 Tax=Desulfovibrio sp. 7SRBS1 TaxID=3378064 RepID=UPI003B425F34
MILINNLTNFLSGIKMSFSPPSHYLKLTTNRKVVPPLLSLTPKSEPHGRHSKPFACGESKTGTVVIPTVSRGHPGEWLENHVVSKKDGGMGWKAVEKGTIEETTL